MKTAFLFPGQGSQVVGMGQDFHQEFDFVRDVFDMAEEICRLPLARLCFKGPIEELTQTVHLQPAITAVNLSILAALQRESFSPQFTAGHSLGEYSSLATAQVVSFEDAFRLVFQRGDLMHRESLKHRGAMSAVVGLSIEAVEGIVSEVGAGVSVANHNAAEQVVITGVPTAVEKASGLAVEKGGRAISLKVSGAWHSELIRGAEEEFQAFVETIPFSPPQLPVIHNVSASRCEGPEEIKSLMVRQLCSPVRWYDSIVKMIDEGVDSFVEVGPGRVLSGLLKKILPSGTEARVISINSLKAFEKHVGQPG